MKVKWRKTTNTKANIMRAKNIKGHLPAVNQMQTLKKYLHTAREKLFRAGTQSVPSMLTVSIAATITICWRFT